MAGLHILIHFRQFCLGALNHPSVRTREITVDQLSHPVLDGYVVKNHSNHNEWRFMPQLLHHRNGKFPNFIVI